MLRLYALKGFDLSERAAMGLFLNPNSTKDMMTYTLLFTCTWRIPGSFRDLVLFEESISNGIWFSIKLLSSFNSFLLLDLGTFLLIFKSFGLFLISVCWIVLEIFGYN